MWSGNTNTKRDALGRLGALTFQEECECADLTRPFATLLVSPADGPDSPVWLAFVTPK